MKRAKKMILFAAICAGAYVAAQIPSGRVGMMSELEGWRYAHRGLHDMERGVPENTLPAFGRAFSAGFGAELDVHLTSDGKLVVIHDSGLERLCGLEGTVEEMSYDELRTLDILGTGHHAPLFEDVLDLCAGSAPLIVELKTYGGNYADLCASAADVLDRYDGLYCIESFDPRAVRWFRLNRPDVIRGQLSADFLKRKGDSGLGYLSRFAITNLSSNFLTRPDFVAYSYEDRGTTARRLCCDLLGAREVSWTVRDRQTMEEAEGLGNIVIFENFVP